MRNIQHTSPVVVANSDGESYLLSPLERSTAASQGGYSEQFIQELLFRNPMAIPVAEVDASFAGLVPVCMELATPAGSIDAFFINSLGMPTLMECKLWRNPQSRREVIGQILDYAKELANWSYEDLQREVSRALKASGNSLWQIVSQAFPGVDEAQFVDAVSRNLRTGRFLLLITGDGIREDVEAIAEYVALHAGLQFTFGLVETPVYRLNDGNYLVTPRILARSVIINRYVIEVNGAAASLLDQTNPDVADTNASPTDNPHYQYWSELLAGLILDDPGQPVPKPARSTNLNFMLPTPGGNNWISVYKSASSGTVGVFTAGTRGTIGTEVLQALAGQKEEILEALGSDARFEHQSGKPCFIMTREGFDPNNPADFGAQHHWLRTAINKFVNIIRPRVENILTELV